MPLLILPLYSRIHAGCVRKFRCEIHRVDHDSQKFTLEMLVEWDGNFHFSNQMQRDEISK